MKAAVVSRFGKDWAISPREVPRPVPGAGELLVRVHAATVNRSDLGELLHPFFNRLITRAKGQRHILGMDFAGVVDEVGPGVVRFKSGDRIFGMAPFRADGAQAEYLCIGDTGWMAEIPAATPFHQAVVCEGAFYANGSIGKLRLPKESPILIYGASGAIGSAAVQLAKYYGFHVTAVVQPQHLAMARTLGADVVLDTDSGTYRELGKKFDFVLDSVGKMRASQWRRLLKPDGVFATTDAGPRGQSLALMLWSLLTRSGRVIIPVPARGSGAAFVPFLKDRIEAGEFKAVIDRRYPLDRISEAYRYVASAQKAGIVVIDVA
jgi:NADPH:quinone reductase-like Zn-dependent oxidoreductase